MKCPFVLLLVACGVQHPQEKAFYDEVEQGSQWNLTFSPGRPWDVNGYPGPCPPVGPKMAHVPDNQTSGCEPGCTCEFSFVFDDTARDGAVSALFTQQCVDHSRIRCDNSDPEHDDAGDCTWFASETSFIDCSYTMIQTRE